MEKMCGIIGKVGEENVIPQLINGLKKLEYRGYDSAGVAFIEDNKINRVRSAGKIQELEKKLSEEVAESNVGIGHTRWATHGGPTEENAHPHRSKNGMFYIVHNGIIENSEEIKKTLLPDDLHFASGTDTEVFAHLLEKYYDGDPVSAIAKAQAVLKGSYAFGILCTERPGMIFAASSSSPLVVAKSNESVYISSDFGAIEENCNKMYCMRHGEICALGRNNISF
jgi:glucosamine--fructose-6-phosphate aminotransferase (isomerizing)